MMSLTPRQADVLAFIRQYMATSGGVGPTVREIMAGLNYRSFRWVVESLDALEADDHIRRLPNRARAIEIIDRAPVPSINGEPLQYIPVHALRSAPPSQDCASGP